ncbi:G1/S-specific cyclin-E2 [Rhagoletis pomonella]|uniref:G1/S-specific cyclin-E2 n=1 Tax=Rhagoletis pomonella TaxID=28610 RepID=UPI00178102E3|nr:G1/S-specific cyclin-E2 [Rhagoletis pomonella]XP_036319101.1 G1/S-specific cyclin-E2 [Rhagoletis pomonella]
MDLLCTENLRNDYDCEVPYVPAHSRAHTYAQSQSMIQPQPHPQSQPPPATTTAITAIATGAAQTEHTDIYIPKEQAHQQQTQVMPGAPSPYSSSSSSLLSPGSSSPSSGYNSATSNSSHANPTHMLHSRQYRQEEDTQNCIQQKYVQQEFHQHHQQQQEQQKRQETKQPHYYEDQHSAGNALFLKSVPSRDLGFVNIATVDPIFLTDRCLENALKAEEKLPQPVCTYFKTVQKDITPPMRKIVAEWMMEVCAEEKCQEEVVLLALNYMDRFLSTKSVTKTHLQILAAACLLLASKLREPSCRALSAELLVFYTDNSIYKGDLIKWELFVLSRLGWDLSSVTPLDFLELLLIRLPIKSKECPDLSLEKVRQHAQAFICLAAKEHYFSIYSASTIAAASIAAALGGLNWHLRTGQKLRHLLNLLTDLTSIEQEYLHECMQKMEIIFEEHSRNLQPYANTEESYQHNQQQQLQSEQEHHFQQQQQQQHHHNQQLQQQQVHAVHQYKHQQQQQQQQEQQQHHQNQHQQHHQQHRSRSAEHSHQHQPMIAVEQQQQHLNSFHHSNSSSNGNTNSGGGISVDNASNVSTTILSDLTQSCEF